MRKYDHKIRRMLGIHLDELKKMTREEMPRIAHGFIQGVQSALHNCLPLFSIFRAVCHDTQDIIITHVLAALIQDIV